MGGSELGFFYFAYLNPQHVLIDRNRLGDACSCADIVVGGDGGSTGGAVGHLVAEELSVERGGGRW